MAVFLIMLSKEMLEICPQKMTAILVMLKTNRCLSIKYMYIKIIMIYGHILYDGYREIICYCYERLERTYWTCTCKNYTSTLYGLWLQVVYP